MSIISSKNVSLVIPDIRGSKDTLFTTPGRFVFNSYLGSQKRGSRSILENINFSLNPGERLAILGANGAGKTTLLRLLAGNMEPSTGDLYVGGRTHSLFNIQMGMHQMGTGRENIFLRGLQLGMSMAEIRRKLESVINFTDLGDNIDRRFSSYSAGMRLRLAIAITLMPDPEILIMDEWIGAGDKTFTKRLSDRLNEYVDGSSALAIASHNMNLVKRICTHAILLDNGQQIAFGKIDEMLSLRESYGANLRKEKND